MKDTTTFFTSALAESDPEIYGAMTKELGRQRDEIEPYFGILGYIRFDGCLSDTATVKHLVQAYQKRVLRF